MGLVKTRRLAAMHPPSPRLRRTGKQQRAKARLKSHPPKVTRPLDPASHSPARAPYHGKSIPAYAGMAPAVYCVV